jgi:hypothetical protein
MVHVEIEVAKSPPTRESHSPRTSGGSPAAIEPEAEEVVGAAAPAGEEEDAMPEQERYTYTAFAHAHEIASRELDILRAVLRGTSADRQPAPESERHTASGERHAKKAKAT